MNFGLYHAAKHFTFRQEGLVGNITKGFPSECVPVGTLGEWA